MFKKILHPANLLLARISTLFRSVILRRRVKTPTIMQMEAVECGAACLAMVLAHFKKFIPLEELRVACGVSRDGSNALNVVRAAREYGLIAMGLRKEPADLRKMQAPMILFWNFHHFVVVDGFSNDKVFLNDPALGRRVVSEDEFDQSFTGIVLTFAVGPNFLPSGQPRSLLGSLRKRLIGAKAALAYLIAIGLLLVIPGVIIPVFTSVFIDYVLVNSLKSWALPLVIGMLTTSALLATLIWLQQYYLFKLEARILISTSAKFLWHALRLPINFYNQRSTGDIAARVGINEQVAQVLARDLVAALLSIGTALFFALIMLLYDKTMSLITIGIVLINALVLRYVAQHRKELNQKLAIDRNKLNGTALNGLTLIETLKASGLESEFFSRWAGFQTRLINSVQEMNRTSIILDLLPKFLTAVNATVVLSIGGMRVMHGEMSIGTLIAFQALVLNFVMPINALVGLGGKIQNFQGDMDRLDDVMLHPCENLANEASASQPLSLAKLTGHLEFRNITFGYSRLDQPLFENFDLVLKVGQRVALVGASGCGKSTIAKLVAGLYVPWSGDILFDGTPIQAWQRYQLLNSVAIVNQEAALFSGTIGDNLSMWDSTVSHADMVAAAKDACIHDVISRLPGGYDAKVDEGGNNFSGGQRQRIEIARALTLNPSLIVLDEATSALDPVTENMINNNLRRRGCSCLIIAHRLSTIRDCDEIILLDKGRVLERGTHQVLMALDGNYARLIANE